MHHEMFEMFDLTGKVALIVGGARNLGFDISSTLAGAGCHIAITSTNLLRGQEAAQKIKNKYAVDCMPAELDHTSFSDVAQVVKTVKEWKGQIDILVNNAGGGSGKGTTKFFERSAEDISKLIETNLTGTLYCCREIGKVMMEQKNGKIINIASVAGIVGRDRRMYERSNMQGQAVDYAAAKAGVIGVTRDMAACLSPMGVYVNCISPGGFNRNLPESFVRDYSNSTPLGRMGTDGVDLNGSVLFLASAASNYITGHNLVVDGGFSIWR